MMVMMIIIIISLFSFSLDLAAERVCVSTGHCSPSEVVYLLIITMAAVTLELKKRDKQTHMLEPRLHES